MNVKIIFRPQIKDSFKKGKCDIWAVIKYKMFPEMEGEFSKADYPPLRKIIINAVRPEDAKDDANFEYEQDFDYPYGTFDIELFWDIKGKSEEELELKPIPEEEK